MYDDATPSRQVPVLRRLWREGTRPADGRCPFPLSRVRQLLPAASGGWWFACAGSGTRVQLAVEQRGRRRVYTSRAGKGRSAAARCGKAALLGWWGRRERRGDGTSWGWEEGGEGANCSPIRVFLEGMTGGQCAGRYLRERSVWWRRRSLQTDGLLRVGCGCGCGERCEERAAVVTERYGRRVGRLRKERSKCSCQDSAVPAHSPDPEGARLLRTRTASIAAACRNWLGWLTRLVAGIGTTSAIAFEFLSDGV